MMGAKAPKKMKGKEQMSRKPEPNSEKCEKVYEFVVAYIAQRGFGPTCREICDMCGITSTSVVNYYVDRLVKQGRLTKDPHISRGIGLPPGTLTEKRLRRRLVRILQPIFSDLSEVGRSDLVELEALYKELTTTAVPA